MLLMICVNDPDNGTFTGRMSAAELDHHGETVLSLECDDLTVERVVVNEVDGLLIEGEFFPAGGYRHWVGNWCWDAVRVSARTAARLAELLRRKHAICTEAESELYDAWDDRNRPITARLLLGMSKE